MEVAKSPSAPAPRRYRKLRVLIAGALCAAAVLFAFSRCSVMMPGDSFKGPLPTVTPQQLSLADQMRKDVQVIAGKIGERNVFQPNNLAAAEDYLALQLARAGYKVEWQIFPV